MTPACQRWIELSDRRAVGEPLTDEERAFQDEHAASCPTCQEGANVWRLIGERPAAVPSEREIDTIPLEAQHASTRTLVHRRRTITAVAAATLACAAAIALWITLRPSSEVASVGPGEPAELSAASPKPRASQALTAPAKIPGAFGPNEVRGEPSCSELVSGVTVCVAAGSRIGNLSVEGAERSLSLSSGRAVVSLVPQPPGTTFSITTPAGKVTAVGTIFSVEVDADGASIVRVSEGRVLVHANGARSRRSVRTGEVLRIGEKDPGTLLAVDRERDLRLLPAELRAHSNGTDETTAPPSSGTQRALQDQMLDEAVALRGRGEFRRAAELYRRLYELSPGSASGQAALVAQGELQLSSLGDPQGALNTFNAYLARGGPLSQEASFGKARALRALGRTAEERQTIERFIATYPEAPQSRVLRRRLAELE